MRLILFLSALLASLAGMAGGVHAAAPMEAGMRLAPDAARVAEGAGRLAAHLHLAEQPTRASAGMLDKWQTLAEPITIDRRGERRRE